MDIRHLKYFVAISEEKSLSAASQRLGVAQPSLSQHVIRLEDELGVALMVRSPRGVVLTDEGHLLVRHAREITRSLDVCISEMKEAGGTVRGPVAFGLPPSVSMVMSVPLAETVRVDLPDVRLQAVESMSGYIKTWLDDGTVDLAFLYDLDRKENFHARHLLDEQLCFFSAPDAWPLDTPPGQPVPLSAIAGLDLILPSPGHGLTRTISRHATQRGLLLNVVIEMDAMTQIKELVARGSGHTIFAPAAAHDFVGRGDLVKSPIIDPVITRPVLLVTNPARAQSRAARAVIDLTLTVARDLVRRGIWEGRLAPELEALPG
ncbi:MAG: LysR family transcriptional regulator [Gemmobacter sp.]|jgi:LysR family nitrogen assimilation transcriptional regulator|nr:LysR family transcriptional regulator [Gemmobacter sp.]